MCMYCKYVKDDWTIDHIASCAKLVPKEDLLKHLKMIKEQIGQYELWLSRPEDGWSTESIKKILEQLKNAQYVAGRFVEIIEKNELY